MPGLVLLAGAYAYALTRFHESFVMVLQVFGVSNLVLLALCAWFVWRSPESRAPLQDSGR